MIIDEAYLYEHMPEAERCLMARIPPEEELNHKFSRRFERKMRALIKYERRTPWERKFYRRMKIAFATIAVLLLATFGSAMSVRASRMYILEFFVEVFEELTSYSVKDDNPEGVEVVPIEPDYVPEGYVVTRRVTNPTEYFVWYADAQGSEIFYNQAVAGMVGRFWDTEVSVTEERKLDGTIVHIVEEDLTRTVYWHDEKYVYRIAGPGYLEVEELLKMARRVMKKAK